MRTLSVALIVVSLVFTPSCKYLRQNVFGKKAREQAEQKAIKDSIRIADSIRKVRENEAAIENARLDSIRLAEEKRKADETKYNIIVGGFVTPEYARILSEQYTRSGYNVRLIKPEESKFELVSLEGHKSLRTARARLELFRDTVELDSWIYITP